MIYLTYAPVHPKFEKNRICGHTYEVMDYHLLLRDNNIESKIVLFDKVDQEKIFKAYKDKYQLYENFEKNIEFRKYKFNSKNRIIGNDIWIITSGFDYGFEYNTEFLVKKIISFECSEHNYQNLIKQSNFILLRDPRLVHKKILGKNVFDYNKKIYFQKYKLQRNDISKNSAAKILVYVNNNLKDLNIKMLEEIKKISINENKSILFVSGTELNNDQIKKYEKYGELKIAPVKNIFTLFDVFIYTENNRNYDCSPRFIAECKFYNKKIISLVKNDIGALARIDDIKNFNKINLNNNDLFLKLINQMIN